MLEHELQSRSEIRCRKIQPQRRASWWKVLILRRNLIARMEFDVDLKLIKPSRSERVAPPLDTVLSPPAAKPAITDGLDLEKKIIAQPDAGYEVTTRIHVGVRRSERKAFPGCTDRATENTPFSLRHHRASSCNILKRNYQQIIFFLKNLLLFAACCGGGEVHWRRVRQTRKVGTKSVFSGDPRRAKGTWLVSWFDTYVVTASGPLFFSSTLLPLCPGFSIRGELEAQKLFVVGYLDREDISMVCVCVAETKSICK
jgi:hypothetical protein